MPMQSRIWSYPASFVMIVDAASFGSDYNHIISVNIPHPLLSLRVDLWRGEFGKTK